MKEIALQISEETEQQIHQLAKLWQLPEENCVSEIVSQCVAMIVRQMPISGGKDTNLVRLLTQEEWEAKVAHHCTMETDGQHFILEYGSEQGISLIPVKIEDRADYSYPLMAHE